MGIFVECEDEIGALAFEMLTHDLIEDLHAGRLIEEVREFIDLEKPFFFISIRPNKRVEKIHMRDVVSVIDEAPDKIRISIDDETYAPYLLPLLWEKFGDRVRQIERNKLEIDYLTEDELMAIPIEDIKIKEIDDIINHIVFHITPIGFRIVKNISKGDEIRYIASENPITDEMIEEVEQIMSRPPKKLTLKREDILKPSERKFIATYRESYI
ncbi:MAG TPA: methanogenesis marker 17 protein [Candidatus Syntrophoarchaeum butanivorans]|uniref:Methanogenesis marker 17 protein n=1 Tax=Candidatus Syntropharchaeum butanivorans TaxID=1839936 RepID=A0A7C1B6M1_9EURY|nr:MAG: methanogenesis marker 17 protein [Candidatus Syntrophoarchaeum sp. WYZ-LMO15]HDM35789.1 methanogenesis marker 17 protein [Candidatus Syntrophoarchaeum butanivorans]